MTLAFWALGGKYGPGTDGEVRCAIASISGGITRHLAHAWKGVQSWETRV